VSSLSDQREQRRPGPEPGTSELGLRTWPEVQAGLMLVVPLGSCEQHGEHLPLSTDTLIAEYFAAWLVRELGSMRAVLAPTVGVGASGEHAGFPGTLSIGTKVLSALLIELTRSATAPNGGPFEEVFIVNGHGGNIAALRDAAETVTGEGRIFRHWSWSAPTGDWHAGRTETSMLIAIAPGLVRLGLASAGETKRDRGTADRLRADGVLAVSVNGVLGDPTGANVEEGQALLAAMRTDLLRCAG
jgi:mycofactocin precursor peptide peptidase